MMPISDPPNKASITSQVKTCDMTPATEIGHFIRAVLEGVAYDGKRALNKFGEYERIDTIIHTGGASTSEAWSQIKADVYGKPVVATKQQESTALGAAMLAMVGAGMLLDVMERRQPESRHVVIPVELVERDSTRR